jgi:transposase
MFELMNEDQIVVKGVIKKGTLAREITRAHVLNLRDKGYAVIEVADILDITPRTVINITNNYEEGGIKKALKDEVRPGQPTKFDARIKAKIVALVCSDPPEGFDRWTLELIKEKSEDNGIVDKISKESIRILLQEHDLKPWQQKMWCIPELNEEYIKRMEAILDIYEKEYDEKNPVICIDENPAVLHENKKEVISAKPGRVKKVDYEYSRNGVANIFCAIEPLQGNYKLQVTEKKTREDFAKFLASIERQYQAAEKITLIMDNYITHFQESLVNFYGKEKGIKIWNKFDIHYTPKHGSWLNQAEIAIGMYNRQCLGNTRIPDIETLNKKTRAWEKIIKKRKVIIKWKFNKQMAREKFKYGEKINLSEH